MLGALVLAVCLQGELPYEIGFECLGETQHVSTEGIHEVLRVQSPVSCKGKD